MESDLLQRARAHLAGGRPDDAGNIAHIFIREIDPKNPEPFLIMSHAAEAKGNYLMALSEAARAAVISPDNGTVRDRFVTTLGRLAMQPRIEPLIARGARRLLDRLRQKDISRRAGSASGSARSIDLVLPMIQPSGSELNLIETAERLRRHVPTRIWSNVPPHPRLLELDPTIELIAPGNVPSGDTLAIMGTYMRQSGFLERARPKRVILHFNVFNLSDLLTWLGATAALPARSIDVLFPSYATKNALQVDGVVLPSPIDTKHFVPREPIRSVNVVGRMSREHIGKHHPRDPALYASLLEMGLGVKILGGQVLEPFLARHDRLTIWPAYAVPARTFLHDLDLFLYRTGASFESWGRVVTEAMACGLPAICDRIGGYAEIIQHGENGYLFETNEEAIELIAAIRNDTPTLKRVSEAARQTIVDLFSQSADDRLVEYFTRL